MQMGNRLPAIPTVVDYEPIAIGLQPDESGNLRGLDQKMPKQTGVPDRCFGNARNRFSRDDQNVDWSLWMNVAKSHHQIVLIDNRGGDLFGGDPFEKGRVHDRHKSELGSRVGPKKGSDNDQLTPLQLRLGT